jgi:cytochrome c oxidase accessory protein FixG
MEFLYRPIERLVDGAPGSRRFRAGPTAARRLLKGALFLAASCFLAHVFLAYFVGIDRLAEWVTRSPLEHPTGFLVMAATTGLMFFDFAYFREQTCLVACPYGRFQSAMTDRHSMIISYDRRRGEPRGKQRREAAPLPLPVLPDAAPAAPAKGDCIDCHLCVTTCPTGIDIRNGLQMECIGCAQCIDACDEVMDKIGKPRGLIRYSSAAILEGSATRLLRPRVFLYPVVLAGLLGLLGFLIATREAGEAAVLPRQGAPFYTLPDGRIANQVRLRLVNRGDRAASFAVSVPPEARALGVKIESPEASPTIAPAESRTIGFVLEAPPGVFSGRGAFETGVVVTTDHGFTTTLPFRMLGPVPRGSTPSEGGPR